MLLVKYATLYRRHNSKQEQTEAAAKTQTLVLRTSKGGPKHCTANRTQALQQTQQLAGCKQSSCFFSVRHSSIGANTDLCCPMLNQPLQAHCKRSTALLHALRTR